MKPHLSLRLATETWPLAEVFTISRGSRTEVRIVTVELSDGRLTGRGESAPNKRYGETAESVRATLENLRPALAEGLDRHTLQNRLPAGAARNALDCAFWDLEAKQTGKRAHEIADLPPPHALDIYYTISLAAPDAMAKAAQKAIRQWPRLKIKLGAEGDIERIRAIRAAVPNTELIVDANEGWSPDNLAANMAACTNAGVALIEQPLPAAADAALAQTERPVPVCADESIHDRQMLAGLKGKYDVINIKLDKTGGLTEALALANEAKAMGFNLMVGCMIATSLGIAPAILIGQQARFVDLDGAALLAKDRPYALVYAEGRVGLPEPALWG